MACRVPRSTPRAVNYGRMPPWLVGLWASDKSARDRQNRVFERIEAASGPLLHIAVVIRRQTLITALLLGLGCATAPAASNQVYRCTGANGKVTLSDRRCPDDDAPAKADAAKSAASGASASASAPKSEARACNELKARMADRRKRAAASDTERRALLQIEDEHRRLCGA